MGDEKGALAYKDSRWDENNKPVGYIIGASPGYAQFGQGEEKLINMGLARKIVKASRMGFDFAMVDYEALSEMYEADIKDQIAHIKKAQGDISTGRKFEVGIHMAVEMDLCIANAYDWKIMHEKLTKGAYSSRKLVEAKFALFHTSSRIRPHVTFKVGQQEPRVAQVSHDGINLGEFMDLIDEGLYEDPSRGNVSKIGKTPHGNPFRGMRDWFIAKFINIMFNAMGTAGDVGTISFFDEHMLIHEGIGFEDGVERIKESYLKVYSEVSDVITGLVNKEVIPRMDELRNLEAEIKRIEASGGQVPGDLHARQTKLVQEINYYNSEGFRQHQINRLVNEETPLSKRYREIAQTNSYVTGHNFIKIYDFWKRHGSQCEEEVAYKVIAKYMWLTSDPLWKEIVGMGYEPDRIIWSADKGWEYYDQNKEKEKTMALVERLITAVAAKYIQGHLFTSRPLWSMKTEDKDLKKDLSVYDYLKEGKVQLFIETAMPPQGQEGQLRIMSAHDHVLLVKHLDGGKFTSYCMDFEHLTDNYISPEDDIKTLKEGDGKYINILHINAPRPIMGAHAPLEPISRDMQVIYRWMFELRKKGMKSCYFIWEMGSYGSKQSAIAFRELVKRLAMDTDPLKLPHEFYGIDDMFEAQQIVNMREHAYDILEGMTATPEETHGMLSTEAARKGKLSEWLRGRTR